MLRTSEEILQAMLADEELEKQLPGIHDVLRIGRGGPDDVEVPPEDRFDGAPTGPDGEPLEGPEPITNPHQPARSPGLEKIAEDFIRGILKVLSQLDEFKKARALLDPATREKLDQFLAGGSLDDIIKSDGVFNIPVSPGARGHFMELDEAIATAMPTDSGVTIAKNVVFQNWGLTVKNTPADTYVPTTVKEVQDIVTRAKANNQNVRVAGYRHTWTDMYSSNGQVLISMLDLKTVEKLPNLASLEADPDYSGNEFKIIELKTDPLPNAEKALCRIGAAVTNEDFRRWCLKNKEWTLPINVIMVEITFGGSNGPICHGAGINSKTLSDLVRMIEYVDCHGNYQQLADPEQLRAAAGCFGLLGVVTHITLELDRMSYADMRPLHEDLLLAIPPPVGFKVPKELEARWAKISQSRRDEALRKFIDTAENDYYAEWFWFPYQNNAFVNAWNKTDDSSGVVNYPGSLETFLQWLFSWVGGFFNDTKIIQWIKPEYQAFLMGTLAMWTMPRKPVKTQLINALHFRRGIQNMRVGDLEVEIPIPKKRPASAGESVPRNWELVQKSWWDAIVAIYADKNVSARIALEMRITGDSTVIMAPQTNNENGTASIEVITSMAAIRQKNGKYWHDFKQKIMDIWTGSAYVDEEGKPLNVRPHWAKEWQGTNIRGKEPVEYLRKVAFEGEIKQFRNTLEAIGKEKGWTLQELQKTFSTPLLDKLIFQN